MRKNPVIFFLFAIFAAVAATVFLLNPQFVRADVVNKSASTTASGLTNTDLNSAASGLVGWWPFDGKYMTWSSATVGTSTDASGNGNNGTLFGMNRGTNAVPGKIGQAMNFNGVNQYITVANSSRMNNLASTTLGGKGYTYSVWVYPVLGGSTLPQIINKENTASVGFLLREDQANHTYQTSQNCVTSGFGARGGTLTYNKWTNIVVTWDGNYTISGHYFIYQNGVSQTLSSVTNCVGGPVDDSTSGHLAIGANVLNSALFTGNLDDVRVYNRALSAQEVSQLYHYGLTTIDNTNVSLTNTDLTSASTTAGGNPSGLTAYYPLAGQYVAWSSGTAGTAADATGNGNSATLENMTRAGSVTAGRSGQALVFDGATAYVQGPSTLIGAGAATVCAWIKQSSFAGTVNAVVANTRFIFFTSSTGNTIGLTSDGTTNAISASNVVANGVWEYVCGTRDTGGIANLYVNGAHSGTANQTSGTPATSGFNTDIGVKGNAVADYFAGSVSDVRIYGRVLSAAEITQLYNATKGAVVNKSDTGLTNTDLTSASTTAGGNPSGLVGYWPFDGKYMTWASGTTTVGTSTDASGNGNNGTLVGMNRGTSVVPGKIGQALSFSSSTIVSMGTVSLTKLGITNNMTMSAWVKLASSTATQQAVITKGNINGGANSDVFFMVTQLSASLYPEVYFSDGTNQIIVVKDSSPPNYLVGWHLLTATLNGSLGTLYYDGTLFATSTNASWLGSLNTTASANTNPLNIGEDSTHTTKQMFGSLDDVRVYSRALSATEVRQLYDMGR